MHNIIRDIDSAASAWSKSLVALVVLSVGMIGIAALYGQGLGASRTALYRTHAVNLAADMADRIRVNRRGGASYGGAAADSNCDPGGGRLHAGADGRARSVRLASAGRSAAAGRRRRRAVRGHDAADVHDPESRWQEVGRRRRSRTRSPCASRTCESNHESTQTIRHDADRADGRARDRRVPDDRRHHGVHAEPHDVPHHGVGGAAARERAASRSTCSSPTSAWRTTGASRPRRRNVGNRAAPDGRPTARARDCGNNWTIDLDQAVEGSNNGYGFACAGFGTGRGQRRHAHRAPRERRSRDARRSPAATRCDPEHSRHG